MTDAVRPAEHSEFLFSIIVPAYNEEAVIETTLLPLSEQLDREGFDYEIIVVDDASTDNTAVVLESLARRLPRLRCVTNTGPNGYGFAIRKGLEHYRGDAAVVVTADGSDAPKDVVTYFRKIQSGQDCAFGTRFAAGAKIEGYPRMKLLVNRLANNFIRLILKNSYDDYTNGFKCYRRQVLESMQPIVSGQFNITIEMAVKAIQGGWRFSVTPTDWAQRKAGTSSFRILKLIGPYAATLTYCLLLDHLQKLRR